MSRPRKLVVDLLTPAASWSLPREHADAILRTAPPEWQVSVLTSPTSSDGDGGASASADALAAVRDAEVYLGYGISPSLFAVAPELRWVHSAAAGVGSTLFPAMLERDVLLTNSAGIHAVPIAEYVVGGILHFTRGFDIALAQQRAGVWNKEPFVSAHTRLRELGESVALLLGTGGIGQAIAHRLTALGCTVVGVRRRPHLGRPPGFARVVGVEELDAELPAANLLIVAAPQTSDTRGLIGAQRLSALPGDAVVVNVARGGLLDEYALATALASGRLRGAVLDVFAEEPLAPTSPLWQLESVLLTPHVSAVSPRAFWERELSLFLENWERYVRDEPLRNVVDKRAGY